MIKQYLLLGCFMGASLQLTHAMDNTLDGYPQMLNPMAQRQAYDDEYKENARLQGKDKGFTINARGAVPSERFSVFIKEDGVLRDILDEALIQYNKKNGAHLTEDRVSIFYHGSPLILTNPSSSIKFDRFRDELTMVVSQAPNPTLNTQHSDEYRATLQKQNNSLNAAKTAYTNFNAALERGNYKYAIEQLQTISSAFDYAISNHKLKPEDRSNGFHSFSVMLSIPDSILKDQKRLESFLKDREKSTGYQYGMYLVSAAPEDLGWPSREEVNALRDYLQHRVLFDYVSASMAERGIQTGKEIGSPYSSEVVDYVIGKLGHKSYEDLLNRTVKWHNDNK